MFDTLSERLSDTLANLRGKGRLSEADIDATAREIRVALLEADVALPVVKSFIAAVKERARGEEVSKALNPAQQVVKIVNEELIAILGGETRLLRLGVEYDDPVAAGQPCQQCGLARPRHPRHQQQGAAGQDDLDRGLCGRRGGLRRRLPRWRRTGATRDGMWRGAHERVTSDLRTSFHMRRSTCRAPTAPL